MQIRGVIFDFDGVIADTEALHLRAYQEALRSTPMALDRPAYYDRYLGYDDVGVLTALAKDQGVSLEAAELDRLVALKGRHFDAMLGRAHLLFPGAADCIRRLSALTTLGIASGALHREIEDIVEGTDLRQHFAAIVAADDVTRAKPAPDVYEEAVRRISGDSEPVWERYVAIEDSQWGLESARAAGLRRIGITHTYPADALAAAEIIVNHMSEIDRELLEALCG